MSKPKKVQSDIVESKETPQKKKDMKTTLRNLFVLVLVAAVSIAGTLAFLSDNSEKKVNTFTGSAGIDVTLTEDAWTSIPDDDKVQGEEMAKAYTPEMVIPKNPTLTNTSATACEEWVALRVDYAYAGDTVTRGAIESTVIEALAINSGWHKLNTQSGGKDTNYEIYLYCSTLSKDGTATLFDQVKIKEQKTLEAKGVYDTANKKYKDFAITLYGAAIKKDSSLEETLSTIKTEDISPTINMDDLDNAVTNSSKDSQKIAVALAKLLKTLPTTP